MVSVEGNVLNGGMNGAVSDPDARYDFIFRNFKAAAELLTGSRSKCSCVHAIFEMKLDRANSFINAASDSVKQSL